MKIGIVDPYFNSFGGGEQYMLTLASNLAEKNIVHVFWDDKELLQESSKRFGTDLSNIKIVQNIFRSKNLLKKLFITSYYDLIIFLTDGSIPLSLAKRNILHVQVPASRVDFPIWKKMFYTDIVFNSRFTQNNSSNYLKKRSHVIYPPVFTEDIAVRFSKRNKMILSVGRFSSYQSVKKQNVLIQAFKFACNKGLYDGYELVLAGGLSQSDNKFFSDLQMSARSYPIRFLPNISRKELVTLYQESGVYWHAAGFGETDPALMEHFGISTVEAMASGCIPVTYQAGGQMEIIRDGQNGFFWTNQDQLLERTKQIIEGGTAILNMRKCASKDAHAFNVAEFIKNWNRVLGEK